MLHPMHERYADLLVSYCMRVEEGDTVLIEVGAEATPIARALVRATLRAGGEPSLRLTYPEQLADVLELAPDAFWDRPPTLELAEIERVQAYVRVDAPHNTHALEGIDPARIARHVRRRAPVQAHRLSSTRWVGTLYPTAAAAQGAGMRLDDFERFVYGAMYLFDDDPVARWAEQRALQATLIERLARASRVRIVAEGTDLTLGVTGRHWVNSDGRKNMPSGEVFTGPIEDSAEGTITFDLPSSVDGVVVRDVRLTFAGGKVVAASAAAGESTLLAKLDADAGARFLGELGIGTNRAIQRPILHTLFDEKIGGTVHLALGRSYAETGGTNESAIHWDLITDLRRGGAIELDGDPFLVDGRFV
ncbi:MAG: aminopeptidase [Trueperaceae bacterium]|nr:aminopeptidase [Trueperaceae bacterium]